LFIKVFINKFSWADTVIVMEEGQRNEIAKRFPTLYLQKRILSFDILDGYDYGDSKLIKALENKMKENSQLLR